MSTVSSPASVPTIRSCSSWSSARAIAGAEPELRLEDDDVSRRRHLAPELPQDRVQQLGRIRAADDMREHVARTTQGIVGLLQPELSDVPRDGRLRDDAAGAGERVQELELRADPLPGDDAFDQPMPLRLAQLHISSIRMQVWWSPGLVEHEVMLRKLLWSAIHGAVAAVAVVVTRRALGPDLAYAHG